MKDSLIQKIIAPFPPDSAFRRIGKKLFRGLIASQKFYKGVIYFDAISQSWALKGTPYESVDAQLKDELLLLSKNCVHYIDVGCNIGQITLSILLRNKNINAVCIDPNQKVLNLLKKSLSANKIKNRATILQAAVGNENGYVFFQDTNKSEMGHISKKGTKVKCLCLVDLVNDYSQKKVLIKIDVEGFETVLLQRLNKYQNLKNITLVIEIHALGYNHGNPEECVKLLLQSGAQLRYLNGHPLSTIDPSQITQIVASWN
jgi:FkbM family methyltransferase